MKTHIWIISLIRLVMVTVLFTMGQVMAEQGEVMQVSGEVQSVSAQHNIVVVDDWPYLVPPNVKVNGVTSPRAYLFGQLSEGSDVSFVAKWLDESRLEIQEIRVSR